MKINEVIVNGKYAMVFPGQGSQAKGMLSALANEYPTVQETFAEASSVLGYDLWKLVQENPDGKLDQTIYAQPALLAAGVALWRVWNFKCKVLPVYVAGHSLGEYTALVCAGALTFNEAVGLVAKRGEFMQGATSNVGGMVAIVGLSDQLIEKVCQLAAVDGSLSVANYNSIGQTVLAGTLAEITEAVRLAKLEGAKLAKILPISVPSHCKLMLPAAAKLKEALQEVTISVPKLAVIHNVDVALHSKPDEIREALVDQLCAPVRWVETIQFLVNHQLERILECGPGKVLTGLNNRIASEIDADFIGNPEKIRAYAGDC